MAAPPGLGHIAALDGLRGLAVAGVVAFHLGWIDGGYLGVDAFFVLSGFLITSLLVAEHDATGGIGLRRFWSRRARRLLPAMLVVVAVVLLWAMVEAPGELAAIRGDAVATLLYVANWHEIATSADYWAIFRTPSPLQHAWSLAIEEQFYLVWPLVVIAVAALAARLRRPLAGLLGPVTLALAVTSYVLMAVLYRAGDVSRAYYGTETRIGAIALGAGLGVLLCRRPGPRTSRRRLVLDAAATVALAGVALAWFLVAGTTPWLYRGGFVLLGLAVVVVIAAVVQPRSRLGRLVAWAPLRGLGLISYGLYLWHWVVIATLTEARTGLSGLALDGVQLGVSLAAALASYWYLEQPIRRRRWPAAGRAAVPVALGAYAAVFGLVLASTLVPVPGLGDLASTLEGRTGAGEVAPTTVGASGVVAGSLPARAAPTTVPVSMAPLPPARVGVFGDSTAMMTGRGLDRYGRENGSFNVVVNDGRVGCGVDQGGERRAEGVHVDLDKCGDLFAHWSEVIADHPVDVAVIQTGQWEIVNHKLAGDTEWRSIGDPVYDAYLLGQLQAVNAFWADRGVPVVWLRAPTPAYLDRNPGPMLRFNQLLDQAVGDAPGATTVPLDAFLAGLSASERARLRPDGVHFDEQTSALVAETWLGPKVAQAIDDLQRITPGPKAGMASPPR